MTALRAPGGRRAGRTDGGATIDADTCSWRHRRTAAGWAASSPLFVPVYDYVLMTEPLTPRAAGVDRLGRARGDVGRGQPVPLLPPIGRRPDPVGRLRRGLPPGQPRRARPTTRARRRSRSWPASSSRPSPSSAGIAFTHAWGGAIDTTTRFTVTFGDARRAGPLRARVHRPRGRGQPLGGRDPARPGAPTRLAAARPRARPLAPVPDPARAHPDAGGGTHAPRGDRCRRPRGSSLLVFLRAMDTLGIGFDS